MPSACKVSGGAPKNSRRLILPINFFGNSRYCAGVLARRLSGISRSTTPADGGAACGRAFLWAAERSLRR